MDTRRTEYEVKIAGTLDLPTLLALGGELLGQGVQKDYYLAGHQHLRLREEQGQFTLTEKGEPLGGNVRIRGVSAHVLSPEEAGQLLDERGVRVLVCKKRVWVRLANVVLRLDEVEHLGSFIEISAQDEASLTRALEALELKERPLIRQSYLELMTARSLPRWVQLVLRFHDQVGELTFGITSGVLTTVGVLVGVNSATAAQLSVIAAVVAVAVADSCSDAFGMYMAKTSERGASPRQALRFALSTLAGKAFIPLTFVVPLLLLPLETAIWVNLAWGALALALLSAEQAVVEQQALVRRLARTLGLALIIVANSALAGALVGWLRE